MSVNHRLNHNFTILANYTYSHCISLGDFGGELSSSRLITNPNNFDADRGNCSFDIRHIFNSSLVANSPRFSSGWMRVLFSDWQLSNILGYRTGNHFSALGGTDSSLDRDQARPGQPDWRSEQRHLPQRRSGGKRYLLV